MCEEEIANGQHPQSQSSEKDLHFRRAMLEYMCISDRESLVGRLRGRAVAFW